MWLAATIGVNSKNSVKVAMLSGSELALHIVLSPRSPPCMPRVDLSPAEQRKQASLILKAHTCQTSQYIRVDLYADMHKTAWLWYFGRRSSL